MSAVPFVDVAAMARWVAGQGVESVIADLMNAIEADFCRWPEFELRPRVPSHSVDGVIELMPTSDGEAYGFKYVNGHPANPLRGYQTVTAFGVLADVRNGYPTFVAEMTLLTAMRTAATSAMAARALARHDSTTMAMIGAGSQAEFQALGMRAALGINQLRIWDIDAHAMEKFRRNATALGFDVLIASSASDAVRGADVVTTCTADKANATVLTNDMVEPGIHINAIGGDCPGKSELDPEILRRSAVFVEYPEQTRIEGEIQHMGPDFEVTQLWQVLSGIAPGRTSTELVSVFDSVGFAIEDFAALRFVERSLPQIDGVKMLDLIADPQDPKDLFSLVTAAGQPSVQASLAQVG